MQRQKVECNFASFSSSHSLREKFSIISSRKEIKMQREKVEFNFASFSPCHSLREKFSKISSRKEIKYAHFLRLTIISYYQLHLHHIATTANNH